MFTVSYPGLVIDQCTDDEGIGMITQTFDSMSDAQKFIDDYVAEFPDYTDLCEIT